MIKFEYPEDALRTNLLMATRLMSRASESCNLVNLGSGSEYDRRAWGDLLTEKSFGQLVPQEDHELSKYVIAKLVEGNAFASNFRLFGVYGPRDNPVQKFISNCIVKCMVGEPIRIHRDRRFSYVYVKDIARFLHEYGRQLGGEGSVNFCGPETHLLSEIAELTRSVCGANEVSIQIQTPGLGKSYTGATEKFREMFGEFRWTTLEKGITETYEFLHSNLSDQTIAEVKKDAYLQRAKMKDV